MANYTNLPLLLAGGFSGGQMPVEVEAVSGSGLKRFSHLPEKATVEDPVPVDVSLVLHAHHRKAGNTWR